MSDAELWFHQASFKTPGGTLINVRALSAPDFQRELQSYGQGSLVDHILNAESVLSGKAVNTTAPSHDEAIATVTQVFPGASQVSPPRIPPCAHGQRVKRSGTSSKGPWTAFFCPTEKGTPGQCEPLFKNRDNAGSWDW